MCKLCVRSGNGSVGVCWDEALVASPSSPLLSQVVASTSPSGSSLFFLINLSLFIKTEFLADHLKLDIILIHIQYYI